MNLFHIFIAIFIILFGLVVYVIYKTKSNKFDEEAIKDSENLFNKIDKSIDDLKRTIDNV
jgi:heme/copper-type cytochrome/quinol oxidase subunit 2